MGANGWEYSVTGADQSQVMDGSVNAWSWGTGNPPALITFQNTCEGVAFVLPTSTQTSVPPTDTPEPTLVATSVSATLPPNATPAASRNAKETGQLYRLCINPAGIGRADHLPDPLTQEIMPIIDFGNPDR